MGKFDNIQLDMELPIPREGELRSDVNLFQSKSVGYWVEHGWHDEAWTLTISREGWLLDPTGQTMAWSGTLNFYGEGHYFGWSVFDAEVKDGKITNVSIVEIPSDLEVVRLPTAEDYAHRERLSRLAKGVVLIAVEPVRTDYIPNSCEARDYPVGSKFTVHRASSFMLLLIDHEGQLCCIWDQRTRDKLEVRPSH
ncbi:hypothetical protein [Yoonia sp. R2-816]|uniref:hypothetical protein n=1 Tax=Yoonia sp. R2-816 TaxID=3342638 RepID=UPI003728C72C